jgi:hypothetical protein
VLQLAALGRQRGNLQQWLAARCSPGQHSTTSREKERETEREREGEPLKPVQRSPLCWLAGMQHASSFQYKRKLLRVRATPTPSNSGNIAPTIANNNNNNSRTYKQKKSMAFNMKHRKWSFSRIELNCKERMKMYVGGGHVITTMSI